MMNQINQIHLGNEKPVEFFIQKGLNVNHRDNHLHTPLHYADFESNFFLS